MAQPVIIIRSIAGENERLGEGPFTLFAPTDEAFAKLPAGTVEDLLKPENLETLTNILLYHVVPGKVMAAGTKISHHRIGVSTHLNALTHSYWMASKMRVREAR